MFFLHRPRSSRDYQHRLTPTKLWAYISASKQLSQASGLVVEIRQHSRFTDSSHSLLYNSSHLTTLERLSKKHCEFEFWALVRQTLLNPLDLSYLGRKVKEYPFNEESRTDMQSAQESLIHQKVLMSPSIPFRGKLIRYFPFWLRVVPGSKMLQMKSIVNNLWIIFKRFFTIWRGKKIYRYIKHPGCQIYSTIILHDHS